ncbi:hypothetical protein ACFX2I_024975 [Malus domestica]
MAQTIEMLTKTIEEKDMQIASLLSKLEERHGGEMSKSAPHLEKDSRQEYTSDGNEQSKPDSTSVASNNSKT